ncbi:thiamine biosynthesis protein ThiF [Candidatus Magnetomorum sp. HK-1]|nr:thiamine biosynthesis protein ThiF [Candidatus Magnetomorum sp. HK-1]
MKNNHYIKSIHPRYERQEKIRGWNQKTLADAHVIVAGAGAIGNEVIKNLCMTGIGHLTIIDDDIIEISNLSRTILFEQADIGKSKALIAAKRARKINPDITAYEICGNLFYDVGLGIYKAADLVIGALDNNAARLQLGIACSLAGTPYLDGAMWAFGGEVRWFLSHEDACFECTLSEDDKKYLHERRSCTGYKKTHQNTPIIPTTVATTSVIGGFLIQEAIAFLLGWEVNGSEAIVYDGRAMTLHRSELTRNPDCPNHGGPYKNIIHLDLLPDDITPKDLLKKTRQKQNKDSHETLYLELGRDCLIDYYCKTCNVHEKVGKILPKLDENSKICPKCGKIRDATIVSQVTEKDTFSHRPLSFFGVPKGQILAVRTDRVVSLYALANMEP